MKSEPTPRATDPITQSELTVGEAAASIGMAASTLRTWERRYGVAPSSRTPAGHRRYNGADIELLRRVHEFVVAGMHPARAVPLAQEDLAVPSASATTSTAGVTGTRPRAHDLSVVRSPTPAAYPALLDNAVHDQGRRRRGGPGGRVLSVRGAGPHAWGLARAAIALDSDAAFMLIDGALRLDGVSTTWEELIRPVLAAAGSYWARTGQGVEVEHLLSSAVTDALRAHRHRHARAISTRPPVVLACAPAEGHALPIEVLAAALTESGRPVRTLGAYVPRQALAATARRTRASHVFVWSQTDDPCNQSALELPPARPPLRVIAGGPGWERLPAHVTRVSDLPGAIAVLTSTTRPGARVSVLPRRERWEGRPR